jgi:ubiquinone/menaquinone biosynthesis C-methylase UbiE
MTGSDPVSGLRRFDDLATGYDAWFTTAIGALVDRREKALLSRMVGPSTGKTILEVGSGTDHFLRELGRSGARCVGLEPSIEMLAIATVARDGDFDHVRGCGERLPFRDGVFDCVAYITTLEFVSDIEVAVREAVRVCKPDGRLAFVVLNARGPWYRQRQREGGLWRETRFFDAGELRSILGAFGALEINYCAHVPPALAWMPAWAMDVADALIRRVRKVDGALIGVKVDLWRSQ